MACTRIADAVREMAPKYEGRIRFMVSDISSKEAKTAVQELGLTQEGHGLVCIDANGKVVGRLEGHMYPVTDVQAMVEKLAE